MSQHPLEDDPRPGAPASRVGRYRLLATIGEGGMGVVHLAQAPDGSRVAVKVLRPHLVGDREGRERLAREVASLRRVTSPRVAEVVDADPWGATPFVATRYVPGLSLHEHVRQHGRVTGPDLAHLAIGLVEALVAVHEVGVLHRDVKPANVLLEGRTPVLIDFGLARLAEDPRLTQAGFLFGTPGYLAPEVLYGEDATTSSDVHSWAATVAYAALGRPPFGTGPAMAVMDRVRRGEHDLRDLPSALAPLVRGALAADPADRPRTFELLAELRRTAPPGTGAGSSTLTRDREAASGPATAPLVLAAPSSSAPPTRSTARLPSSAPTTARLPVAAGQEAATARLADRAPVPPTRQFPVPVTTPAREPYMQPPPPRQPATLAPARGAAPRHHQPLPAQPLPADHGATATAPAPGSGLRRTALLGSLLSAVALGFAAAPYVAALVLSVLALVVRTLSWTADSGRVRQVLRGRRRWYDGPLTVLSTPWYLLLATAGTLVLVTWAALLTAVAGLAVWVFAGPLLPGMVLLGAVFAAGLWWGPGGGRVRRPIRRVADRLSRSPALGWAVTLAVGGVALVCFSVLLADGVSWEPSQGAPWRDGTSLGGLLGWL